MESLNNGIKDKIVGFLKLKGNATSSEIAKNIGHNRITVAKYLEIMKAKNIVDYDAVANAKLWHIKKQAKKPKVLIVDDEKHIVELISLSLIPEQYEIFKAYSGKEALSLISSKDFDIVILDLMMPGMDGYEVCKKIRKSPKTKNLPIIILSAKGQLKDKLKGLNLGADDYITKPFDPLELEARVNAKLRMLKSALDANPLTKLPGRESFKNEVFKWLMSKESFVITQVNVLGLSDIAKKYGYKKHEEAIKLISKVLASKAENAKGFIFQSLNNSFIILSELPIAKKIDASFRNILSYIVDDGKLGFDIKEIKSKELKSTDVEHIADMVEI